MEITESLIDHLSKLARLSFEGEEKEKIKNDLNPYEGLKKTFFFHFPILRSVSIYNLRLVQG